MGQQSLVIAGILETDHHYQLQLIHRIHTHWREPTTLLLTLSPPFVQTTLQLQLQLLKPLLLIFPHQQSLAVHLSL